MKRFVAPFLLLMAVFIVGWTELVDNFYGKNLDKTTFQAPPDTAVPVYSTATGKWSAIAGGGGAASDASTVTKGITKLTVPPASATSPIAVGANDPSVNPTPTAANAGNIPVVPTGGGAYTHIDPPAGTDTFLASLGTAVPGAFRAIIDTDIDELLTFEQLVDVTITGAAAGDIIIRNAGNTLWVNQAKGSPSTVFLVDSGGGMPTYGLVTSAMISNGTITDVDVDSANKDGVAGTASMRTLGTGAQQAAAGNDSRLSDARTPTAHAASHQNGGSDEVATATPGANAIPKADGSNKLASGWLSEVLNLADLLDATMTGLANNDILMRIGGAWVNAVSAGDVTWTGSGNTITTTIGANKVTLGKMAQLATARIIGNDTGSTANPAALVFGGSPADPGTAAASGSSSAVPRLDHVHNSILPSTTSDPTNEREYSYDTGDGMVQSKILIGRVVHPGTWFVQTADSTAIQNTASETDFDQLPSSFPANSLKAGRTLMWWATYIASTTGTPTIRIRHKFGTVTVSDTSNYTTSSSMTNRIFTMHGKMTIRTVGASGTYLADITYGPVTINSTGQYVSSSGPTSEFGTVGATIDTTVGNVLKDTAQWSAASASNTIKRVALTVVIF